MLKQASGGGHTTLWYELKALPSIYTAGKAKRFIKKSASDDLPGSTQVLWPRFRYTTLVVFCQEQYQIGERAPGPYDVAQLTKPGNRVMITEDIRTDASLDQSGDITAVQPC
jgi:hypothetical protein